MLCIVVYAKSATRVFELYCCLHDEEMFFFQFKISLVKCWCAIAPPLP